MTDNEIKKALECCFKGYGNCEGCPYDDDDCITLKGESLLMRDVLDLINRQQVEIERLNKAVASSKDLVERIHQTHMEILQKAKSEAIEEFAERLETALDERASEKIRERNPHWYLAKRIVRETAIEMTENDFKE